MLKYYDTNTGKEFSFPDSNLKFENWMCYWNYGDTILDFEVMTKYLNLQLENYNRNDFLLRVEEYRKVGFFLKKLKMQDYVTEDVTNLLGDIGIEQLDLNMNTGE